jgi:hypothetical protein
MVSVLWAGIPRAPDAECFGLDSGPKGTTICV